MEAAFWSWTHDTPAAHIYGVYTSQHSCRTTIYHTREQLHSLQQTMYFDENIYPHLPPALLDRILRVRALVNHATDDLTAALDHIEAIGRFPPDQLKGKGKGQSKSKTYDPTELTDDPTTSIHQSDLVHPFTRPQTMAPPRTTPPPVIHTTTLEHSQQIASQQNATPDFPHTALAPKPSYTCMHSANSCIFTPTTSKPLPYSTITTHFPTAMRPYPSLQHPHSPTGTSHTDSYRADLSTTRISIQQHTCHLLPADTHQHTTQSSRSGHGTSGTLVG